MNIRDLKYVIAVADKKSFVEAAKQEYVSQPALSMQIAKLEDELGVKIFERSKKNFIVTDVGKIIIESAKKIVNQLDDLKNEIKFYQDPYQGDLVIGAFPTLASYFYPNFLDKAIRILPKIRFLLIEEKTEILIKKLEQGKIDIAFLANPVKHDNLHFAEIFCEEFYLAVNHKHQFAKYKKISLSQIDSKELMLLDEGHCLRDQALEVCFLSGIKEQNSFRATSLETLRQMVAVGAGITLVPKIAIDSNPKIKYIAIKEAPKRTISIFYRKNYSRMAIVKKIEEIF